MNNRGRTRSMVILTSMVSWFSNRQLTSVVSTRQLQITRLSGVEDFLADAEPGSLSMTAGSSQQTAVELSHQG